MDLSILLSSIAPTRRAAADAGVAAAAELP